MTDVDDQTAQENSKSRASATEGPELASEPARTEDETQQAQMASDAQPESPGRLEIPDVLPVLPLRGGTVVFPLAVVPLMVGQERSIKLIDDVMRGDRLVALVAQRGDEPRAGRPGRPPHDRHRGHDPPADARPDGTVRLIVQGLERIRLREFVQTEPYLVARVERRPEPISTGVETRGCAGPWSTCSGGWCR